MVAHWQAVGFAHGVMNTDNMSILGLTIDYGPFGFLDGFDPGHICNHSDTGGRYAFARQPNVAWWNLHALGHALQAAVRRPRRQRCPPVLDTFGDALHRGVLRPHARQAGPGARREDGDKALLDDLLGLMAGERVDHTIALRALGAFDRGAGATPAALRDHFIDRAAADAWGERYLRRLEAEPRTDAERRAAMDRANPKIHPAQPPGAGRDRPGRAGRLRRGARAARSCCAARTTSSPTTPATRRCRRTGRGTSRCRARPERPPGPDMRLR